ncbi:hypothetical protein [Yersinia phage vB_Yru_GN1]|uniref:Uncharacterized protein n=1 Tax=Yersinia phage vB_Yru_GN1 TaxID=3074381 RepID=A0AA86MGW5_9CAUD|nr:hypothetical protein [Yersinia phage vB_Yru_GN1]
MVRKSIGGILTSKFLGKVGNITPITLEVDVTTAVPVNPLITNIIILVNDELNKCFSSIEDFVHHCENTKSFGILIMTGNKFSVEGACNIGDQFIKLNSHYTINPLFIPYMSIDGIPVDNIEELRRWYFNRSFDPSEFNLIDIKELENDNLSKVRV